MRPAAIGAAAGARRGSRAPRKTRARTPILVVDDGPQMLRYVRDALAAGGYAPLLTGNPEELPGLVRTHRPRLVLLDLRLPGTDGIELMERIPELGDLPVIFISAYGRDETIVRALDAGAADYIVNPFSPTELTARVRAALRRRAAPEPFLLGELAIGYDERRVTVAGRPVELTATEFELLRVLSINAGQVVRAKITSASSILLWASSGFSSYAMGATSSSIIRSMSRCESVRFPCSRPSRSSVERSG